MSNLRIIIAGGGTGGHFYPALAIGHELKNRGAEIMFMGSKHGIESKIYTDDKIKLLNIRGIIRSVSIKSILINLLFPFRFIISYLQSVLIIVKFNPQVVVGTGGYASGLPILAAIVLNKKILLQEQNSYPGITTRKLSSRVDSICIAYKEAQQHLSKPAILTGNPIRSNLNLVVNKNEQEIFGLNTNKTIIFILGGSQGSHPFNKHFLEKYDFYMSHDIQLLWQTGERDFDYLDKKINQNNIKLFPFIDDMSKAYYYADIVISRAGALAIEELKSLGKAMILIPFPHAAGDHQTKNAKSLVKENAAISISEEEMKEGHLEKIVFKVLKDKNKLKKLRKNAKKMSYPNALSEISDKIIGLATQNV